MCERKVTVGPVVYKVITDLWWAIRGGGSSLGVAVRYKAKAFPVPVVFAGNLL